MTQERFTLPSAVFLILEQDGKVLLGRRSNTSWHNGDYDLPAGHIDGQESSTAAAAREGAEELGITVDPAQASFQLIDTWHIFGWQGILQSLLPGRGMARRTADYGTGQVRRPSLVRV